MRKIAFLTLVTLMLTAFAPMAMASSIGEGDIAGLTAFTAESNYMSLPGYYRWQTYLDQGVWLPMLEALRAVKAQGMNPPWSAEAVADLLKAEKSQQQQQ